MASAATGSPGEVGGAAPAPVPLPLPVPLRCPGMVTAPRRPLAAGDQRAPVPTRGAGDALPPCARPPTPGLPGPRPRPVPARVGVPPPGLTASCPRPSRWGCPGRAAAGTARLLPTRSRRPGRGRGAGSGRCGTARHGMARHGMARCGTAPAAAPGQAGSARWPRAVPWGPGAPRSRPVPRAAPAAAPAFPARGRPRSGRARKRRGAGARVCGAMGGSLLLPLLLPLLPGAAGGAAVCGLCPGPPRNGSVVSRYCASRAGAESDGRCCRERGARPERLLGLDLSNCSLRSLPPALAEAAATVVLDLTDNPLTALPNGSFLGFTQLQCLAVPRSLQCPGGSGAWDEVTASGGSRLCRGQRNLCNSSGELAWPCPENAACAPAGPGLAQCLCSSPFHGYKCLREGAFPVLLFCGILGAVTLSLSVLLWGTQRRKAKTP